MPIGKGSIRLSKGSRCRKYEPTTRAEPRRMIFEVPTSDFSLHATLTSGQTFRWRPDGDGAFCGVIGTALVRVKPRGEQLFCETSSSTLTAADLRRYFALDLPLGPILSSIDVDMQIHQAIVRHRGLRILRQEGWETLASFICASFNNIKRIEGMIERLCRAYGEPVASSGSWPTAWGFPHPEAVAKASERSLRRLGLGYRAPYVKATAQLVADGKLPLAQLRRLDYDATKATLLRCEGVGDKVADCVALFGFEKYEAFPIDVWMERAMRYYFRHRKMTRKLLHDYARRHFGPYAGYAQQYLYHYVRNLRAVSS